MCLHSDGHGRPYDPERVCPGDSQVTLLFIIWSLTPLFSNDWKCLKLGLVERSGVLAALQARWPSCTWAARLKARCCFGEAPGLVAAGSDQAPEACGFQV